MIRKWKGCIMQSSQNRRIRKMEFSKIERDFSGKKQGLVSVSKILQSSETDTLNRHSSPMTRNGNEVTKSGNELHTFFKKFQKKILKIQKKQNHNQKI